MSSYFYNTYTRESLNTYKQKNNIQNTPIDMNNAFSICIDWQQSQPVEFEINVNKNQNSFSSIPIEMVF